MQVIRSLIAAAMAWAAMGGAGASEAGPTYLLAALQVGGRGQYISAWDGNRISAQALRQVW